MLFDSKTVRDKFKSWPFIFNKTKLLREKKMQMLQKIVHISANLWDFKGVITTKFINLIKIHDNLYTQIQLIYGFHSIIAAKANRPRRYCP